MSMGGHEWWTSGVRETDRGYGRRMVLDLLTGASMSTGSQGKSTSWWESHYFPSDIKVGSPVVHVLSSWGYSDGRPLASHATLRLCFSPFLSSFSFLLSVLSLSFSLLSLFFSSYTITIVSSRSLLDLTVLRPFAIHLIPSLSLEGDATTIFSLTNTMYCHERFGFRYAIW